MFTRLRTKLTVLYASLFGIALVVLASAVSIGISTNAARAVRDELSVSGAVFDRIWALRAQQLEDSASILARDFGFRAAVATGDAATTESALENLRVRLKLDTAFLVTVDGALVGDKGLLDPKSADLLWSALDDADSSGVLMLGKDAYQIVAAPVMAPVLTGWVVFAVKLDRAEMASLEQLSAIPLTADIYHEQAESEWRAVTTAVDENQAAALSRFVVSAMHAPSAKPQELQMANMDSIALVKPLPALDPDRPVALMLRYPLALALKPYRPLLVGIWLMGLLGLALLVAGSWALARNLTRPITALADAALRLQRGERVTVPVESKDEIGGLAESFNAMAEEIHERERQITHLALHDVETTLPNRAALERALNAAIEARGAALVTSAALGIERFQFLRSAIGYRLAAALVEQIGARLQKLYPECHVARVSSDVLGIVFEARDEADARSFAQGMLNALDRPYFVEGDAIDVNFALGLAIESVHGRTAPQLLERASIALDQARAQNALIALFDETAYGDPAANLSLMSDMLRATIDGDMEIHYQPKLDIRTRAITGVEALLRWRNPKRGQVRPDDFILMAEETGAIRPLTEWVIAEAMDDQRALAAAGHDIRVSVNISGRLLNDEDFARAALKIVAGAKSKLCFEITETAMMENPQLALKIIAQFAAAGIDISIDDYGAGLSSLTYLRQIQANELKIDKSFVLALREGHRDALLVKSTIDLAHSLGLHVTAEGVETPEALMLLASMGCDHAQGYLVGRAMGMNDLRALLQKGMGDLKLVGAA